MFLPILFSGILKIYLFLSPAPAPASKAPAGRTEQSTWSGTITYTYTRTSYHAAPYSQFVFHKWNHFYEQREEAKIVNGKGAADRLITLLDTTYDKEQMGSRVIEQWQIDKGTAQGAGNTEVTVSIDPKRQTYTIELPVPAASGNKTRTNLCKGCGQAPDAPRTMSMGEDETEILVENQKLGANPNVLSGQTTELKKIDNGEGKETIITRWTLSKGKS